MRPGQNKRMRGRNNNNNRKGPNPLTRSYESNGPDVKIRGTAHHIGEKYLQLARDAQSSGDPVMAESYLQHAEHYFRLIAAAQQAQQQAQFGYQRQPGDQAESDEDDSDDDFTSLPDRFASPSERPMQPPPQQMPQPYPDRQPHEQRDRQPYEQRQDRPPRDYDNRQDSRQDNRQANQSGDRQPYEQRDRQYDNRRDRNNYQDRNGQERNQEGGAPRNGQERSQDRSSRDYDNRNFRNRNRDYRDQPRDNREPRQPGNDEAPNGLPAFITSPTRVQIENDPPAQEMEEHNAPVDQGDDAGLHMRPRRRRRPKSEFDNGDSEGHSEAPASDPVAD